MKTLYIADVTVNGGREGRAVSSDKALDVRLALPKQMGGNGAEGATNPEQLFAAGYAACFESAVRAVAGQKKKKITNSTVQAKVEVGPREAGGFGLAVTLEVSLDGVSHKEAEELVEIAHRDMCPYSHATRGNIDVDIRVV